MSVLWRYCRCTCCLAARCERVTAKTRHIITIGTLPLLAHAETGEMRRDTITIRSCRVSRAGTIAIFIVLGLALGRVLDLRAGHDREVCCSFKTLGDLKWHVRRFAKDTAQWSFNRNAIPHTSSLMLRNDDEKLTLTFNGIALMRCRLLQSFLGSGIPTNWIQRSSDQSRGRGGTGFEGFFERDRLLHALSALCAPFLCGIMARQDHSPSNSLSVLASGISVSVSIPSSLSSAP